MKNGKKRVHVYTAFSKPTTTAGTLLQFRRYPVLRRKTKTWSTCDPMAKDAIQCYIEGLKKAKEPISVEKETAQLKISVVA